MMKAGGGGETVGKEIPKKPLPPKTTIFLGMITARAFSKVSVQSQDLDLESSHTISADSAISI